MSAASGVPGISTEPSAPEGSGPGPDSPGLAPRPVWRPLLVWSAGILLFASLAWFVGAVAVPMVRLHRAVARVRVKDYGPLIDSLGGDQEACRRLRQCLYWPGLLAPDKVRAAELLDMCKGGRSALTAVLLDRKAPTDARVAIAAFLGAEQDNAMDRGDDLADWRVDALSGVLDDPSGRVRVAAARSMLRRWYVCPAHRYDAALEQLARCLKDRDVLVRRDAARALRDAAQDNELGPVTAHSYRFAPVAEPALKEALGDADPVVRAEAAEALKFKLRKPVQRFGPGVPEK